MAQCYFVGLAFCFATATVLGLISLSVPLALDGIYFLKVQVPGEKEMRYGCFGYSGSGFKIGYSIPDVSSKSIDHSEVLNSTALDQFQSFAFDKNNPSKALIIHALGCFIILLAAIAGICSVRVGRHGVLYMVIISFIALMSALAALIIDFTFFTSVQSYYRSHGISAQLGNACWMACGAFVTSLMAFVATSCSTYALYRKDRKRSNMFSGSSWQSRNNMSH